VDDAGVTKWLDDYVAAWRTYDVAAVGSLFSEGAVYRFHPWADAQQEVRGRDAIVAKWLEEPDAPERWSAEYSPWLVAGDRAVATGVTRYYAADGATVEEEFHNVFLLHFDPDGRCSAFTELYMLRTS
jgi:ketosteroid isomerase-like protein